ncbi:uridine diphosphate-N-acetylglucosamine-binding protein YvcK [Candidatus Dojkabacteria bacterium]|nr:uridine diphosphate-N-acetylglucosamine-binding protein YvcK [Candidatus Dojkabacteria bacterium]
MSEDNKFKVCVIGGGTGTVSILNGLKKHDEIDLSVIVSMTDDGGSNRVVRDEFGLLPLSDLRKSIVALAQTGNGVFRELFTYRFDKGEGLSGHTLGNLMMMALSDITGSEVHAIRKMCKLFNVRGKVIPVTLDDSRLVARYEDGTIIKGEHWIDEPMEKYGDLKIEELMLDPSAKAHEPALEAISEADYIIAGPGDLYTSTITNIIVEGVAEAIKNSKAKYIFITNLMTKKGQTHWMKASDMVDEISKYSKRKPDYVLINNREIPEDILTKYKEDDEFPIKDNLNEDETYKIFKEDLIGEKEIVRQSGDVLVRSLVRHDSEKLRKVLYDIFTYEK